MLLKNKCKDLRRKVPLRNIIGLTLSYHEESAEFVAHIEAEPDIRFVSPQHRKQIMDTIKMFSAT